MSYTYDPEETLTFIAKMQNCGELENHFEVTPFPPLNYVNTSDTSTAIVPKLSKIVAAQNKRRCKATW
jgi:hypothetical protein